MIFKWRLVNEDYEGRSDDSSLEIEKDHVVATCNGESVEYPLVPGETVAGEATRPEWPLDPTDKVLVGELTLRIFGRQLA